MNRLGFWWRRLRGADFPELEARIDAVLADLRGRSVALVGNARSMAGGSAGAEIDAADLVIRLNAGHQPSAQSHGIRTDWMWMSKPVPQEVIGAKAPARIVWMTPRRKRLPWYVAGDPRTALLPREWSLGLREELGSRPTTGLLSIDLLRRSEAREVTIRGFDFFASQSLSGRRQAKDVPHDFAAEKAWVEALLARDARFTLS